MSQMLGFLMSQSMFRFRHIADLFTSFVFHSSLLHFDLFVAYFAVFYLCLRSCSFATVIWVDSLLTGIYYCFSDPKGAACFRREKLSTT